MIDNKTYDILKWVCIIVLPSLATLYSGIAKIWNLPYVTEIPQTIIVIDANNGQNALTQAKQFSEAVKVTGIIVTKLDGSAKGGVIIGISKELGLPVYLVGVGEKIEDLRPFDPNEFVEALFE